jgi:pimeloyl-ACP methyl ester carboxylesterase
MQFMSKTPFNGAVERLFTLGDISGVLWEPASAGPRPLILLGHGGGQHKKAPGLLARASRFVAGGFAVAAIDAPGHGDRSPSEEQRRMTEAIRDRAAQGEPLGPIFPGYNATMAAWAIPEWRATLDELLERTGPAGPVGYWGVSMGGAIGVWLAAAEPRITAAVLGLVRADGLTEAAASITIPVEFLVQWDDEMVPRDSALALFGAFGSAEKSLHANAGGHMDVPRFEVDSSARFFARHLVTT